MKQNKSTAVVAETGTILTGGFPTPMECGKSHKGHDIYVGVTEDTQRSGNVLINSEVCFGEMVASL